MDRTRPRFAIAAPNSPAAQAALIVAQEGGSVVDAAIAGMCVTFVTEPGIVSALGGAFVNVWPAAGDPVVVEGNIEMPGRGLPAERMGGGLRKFDLAYGGGITVFGGAGSAGTPGAFAAFEVARDRFGQVPLTTVLAPAAKVARDGFALGASSAGYIAMMIDSLFDFDPRTRAQHTDDAGHSLATGAIMRNPALADTFDHLAQVGFGDLYHGDLARALAEQMEAEEGIITWADLESYQARCRPAARARLRAWDVAMNPPPSIGGPVLTAMLRLLDNDPTMAQILQVQDRVLRYRARELDLAPDLEVAGKELLQALETNHLESLPTSQDTAHISVVDADGNACSITSSAGYSSGVTVGESGLVLNNCLGEPELNRLGTHALEPGTRIASNMAPTIARNTDGSVLSIGTPGADRITTTLMQVLTRFALQGASLQEAIDAPRAHVIPGGAAPRVEFEPDEVIAEAIAQLGWQGNEHEPLDMYFGGVGAALASHAGELTAAADPRRAAATAIG